MKLTLCYCILALSLCLLPSFAFDSTKYTSVQVLDSSINYKIWHKINGDYLEVALVGDTTGWLGFGLGEQNSGSMKGSDIVTVAVEPNGNVVVTDRYCDWVASNFPLPLSGLYPTKDPQNDWELVSGSEVGGTTAVEIKRKLVTGDRKHDRDVLLGDVEQRTIWAWGGGDDVMYHGSKRGATTTRWGGSSGAQLPAHDGTWNFTFSGYTIPTQKTTYACQGFEFPQDRNRHIVAVRPLLHSATKEYAHHAILHVCTNNSYFTGHTAAQLCGATSSNTAPGQGQGSSPLGGGSSQCSSLMWSWAKGQGDFILPEQAGFPVGDYASGDASHVILEIHYDNPNFTPGLVDYSGFTALYVDTRRPHDAAGITLGDPTVSMSRGTTYQLPAGKESIHREGVCPSSCTSQFTHPLKVFHSFLHMHAYGRKMLTSHYGPNGEFKGVTNRVDFWDFEFQQGSGVNFTIQPGDRLHTHCYFDTTKVQPGNAVAFGTGSEDEMCMDFLFYYPAVYKTNVRFAFCGGFFQFGLNTLCGSLGEPNPLYYLMFGGQTPESVDHYFSEFGSNNADLQSPTSSSGGGRIKAVTIVVAVLAALLVFCVSAYVRMRWKARDNTVTDVAGATKQISVP